MSAENGYTVVIVGVIEDSILEAVAKVLYGQQHLGVVVIDLLV